MSLGITTVGEGSQLHPKINRILSLNWDDGDLGYFWIHVREVGPESPGIFLGNERARLEGVVQACSDQRNFVRPAVDHLDPHRDRSRSDHSHHFGGGVREVEYSPFGKRSAVVNGNFCGPSVIEVGNHHSGAEGQSLVRGGKLELVVDGPAGRGLAMEPWAVPRGDPGLARTAAGQ